MSAELTAMEKHLESLEAFLASPAFVGYQAAVAKEIQDTETAIIMVDPVDRQTEIENLKLRGELRCLHTRVTLFEDARVTLKNRIDEQAERETQNAGNVKQ